MSHSKVVMVKVCVVESSIIVQVNHAGTIVLLFLFVSCRGLSLREIALDSKLVLI